MHNRFSMLAMNGNGQIAATLSVAIVGWLFGVAYKALKPPPPKICGSLNGPAVTSPRIKLADGRHLAYREFGVPKEQAAHKIVVVHGFGGSKDQALPVSRELIAELKIYFLHFDRAGYGESDPFPSRSVKSEAFDIQELADKLEIGSKFYVMGISMGAYSIWSSLKYIPERLSGAALVVPFVSYWWPCLPTNLSKEAFALLPLQDQWTFRVARHCPRLFYWWMTQKWFPSLSLLSGSNALLTEGDLEIIKATPSVDQERITQQGVHESLHRDIMVGFGPWEFDPTGVANPFPGENGSVHIWQGYEDKVVPFQIQRYIADKLPWIRYHEVPRGGHAFAFERTKCEAILQALLDK